MSTCDDFTIYANVLTKLSSCSNEQASKLVDQLVNSGLIIAEHYGSKKQLLMHELFLRQVFHDVLDKICDPLISRASRCIYLDHIHKPLFALKRFYREHHNELTAYYKLERELRILSFEFL
jgi:hypothetical protein